MPKNDRLHSWLCCIYLLGLAGWALVSWITFRRFHYQLSILFSHAFCVSVLGLNAYLQCSRRKIYKLVNTTNARVDCNDPATCSDPDTCNNFKTVELVYEYVERNSYYLII